MDDLGSPAHWRLKGAGNANLVFGYVGDAPHLAGTVLRVRKPRPVPPPQQQALEDAVWGPVLGGAPPAAAASGRDAASAAAAAAAREQRYVQQLLAPLLGSQHIPPQRPVRPDPRFLRQLLQASGCEAGGSGEVGDAAAAVPAAALMPDVTLLPPAAPPAGRQHAEGVGGGSPGGGPAAAGPVVCLELKPKCGFVAACPTVHPANRALKRSRSRYQLHQLLKLAQGKVGSRSAYDPRDLFSGEPARVRAALAALLAAPQNNLALFVDGRRAALPGQQPRRQQQERQQREEGGAGTMEGLLGGLLPLPAAARRGALVELLAAVLLREGVLPRLLAAQQQCEYDVEGVHRLYCRCAGLPQPAEAPAGSGGSIGRSADNPGSSSGGGSGEPGGCSGAEAEASSEDAAEHAAAVQRLLSLPAEQAHAVLRAYVVAATAKDCAIMVALQRLAGPPPGAPQAEAPQQAEAPHGGWAALPPGYVCCPAAAGEGGTAGGGADAAGAWFRYRVSFVDLDLKPLAKVPAHAALDGAILEASRRHAAAARERQRRAGGEGGGDDSDVGPPSDACVFPDEFGSVTG